MRASLMALVLGTMLLATVPMAAGWNDDCAGGWWDAGNGVSGAKQLAPPILCSGNVDNGGDPEDWYYADLPVSAPFSASLGVEICSSDSIIALVYFQVGGAAYTQLGAGSLSAGTLKGVLSIAGSGCTSNAYSTAASELANGGRWYVQVQLPSGPPSTDYLLRLT